MESAFPGARVGRHPAITKLAREILRFLRGETVDFALDGVALEICSEFQRRVLEAEYRIPRGWVSTYGGIAAHLRKPTAARAVGRALATNRFPVIIPCHRAIAGHGGLGGYQGGIAMKRALLRNEGVEISPDSHVVRPKLFYPFGHDGHPARLRDETSG